MFFGGLIWGLTLALRIPLSEKYVFIHNKHKKLPFWQMVKWTFRMALLCLYQSLALVIKCWRICVLIHVFSLQQHYFPHTEGSTTIPLKVEKALTQLTLLFGDDPKVSNSKTKVLEYFFVCESCHWSMEGMFGKNVNAFQLTYSNFCGQGALNMTVFF